MSRALLCWRVLAIAAIVGLVGLGVRGAGDMAVGFAPYIARIEITGVIVDDPRRDDRLLEIRDDPKAKALVARIDSPGGTVVGGETLFRYLRLVAEKKPVVAVMGELATSAGYMTAIGADHVLARDSTVTGSIGVIMQTADVTGLLNKIGVRPEVLKSSDIKATPNPFEPFTDKQRDAARVVVLDMFEMFKSMVAERRGFDDKTMNSLADGRIFTGRQALKLGLIDAIGGELEAKDWLVETRGLDPDLEYMDVRLEPEEGPLAGLFEGILGKTFVSERLRLDGLISLWQPTFR